MYFTNIFEDLVIAVGRHFVLLFHDHQTKLGKDRPDSHNELIDETYSLAMIIRVLSDVQLSYDNQSVVGCEMKSGVFDLRSESRTLTSHPPKSLLVLKTDTNT